MLVCWVGFSTFYKCILCHGILNIPDKEAAPLSEVIRHLESIYCGHLSVELNHLSNEEEKQWLAHKLEESTFQFSLSSEKKKHVAKLLMKAKTFDDFLAKKFPTFKRYCGAGAESALPFIDELLSEASAVYGIEDVVIGMAHRGKLELLVCILDYSPVKVFSKIIGKPEFPEHLGTGDVASHLSISTDVNYGGEKPLHVSLIPNPSHLEAQDPVACGKTRSKQLRLREGHYGNNPESRCGDRTLCLQVHGDAAFTAQGIVAETLCMANLPHYTVGGSVHLIVNNQLGFTTPPEQGRSSRYSSDIGKMIECPVFHVNGDHPEEVMRACRLAMEYRMKYRKDVIVDMLCYRRWGHNEMDEPAFTQPTMYDDIVARERVPDLYLRRVAEHGVDVEEIVRELEPYKDFLSEESKKAESHQSLATSFQKQWRGLQPAKSGVVTHFDTGCDLDVLLFVGAKSCEVERSVNVHPHLRKTFCNARMSKLEAESSIDWACAEALAIGSLLYQGHNVRVSGQDVGRGTFSHRHVMLVCQDSEKIYIPLNHMFSGQNSFLEVCNSPLSEEAVLGFEYGMSIDDPNNLIIWEAQFGDFYNGAQVIVDTFVAAGETKWLLQSGLVMLLPHGMDGMGPEHSSCRIERFLQLSDSEEDTVDGDNVNIHVVNPTTPAQYFHLLRRQIVRNFRKPLVVASPKLLLRSAVAVSKLNEMAPGSHFHPVLGDEKVDPSHVKCVVFCSGKYYYTLLKERENRHAHDMAIVRLEALTPFPVEEIKNELKKYPNALSHIWCQEEHRNMGPWTFVNPRFLNLLGVKLKYVGRKSLATPAVGIGKVHAKEAEEILQSLF
ncbi:probable 2-oxoglutarate dehydrogenase E1 component DHKTD1, mitochondrial isoform X2 [Xenia sp. Carnegie-2017]|uniref:probable 2-oxoglutarate dehydrogenase E1 component DHKTD1, mitochondrial isoform X2 n=1 Tax=Xenia sp. Carnegie-2017 TaxID=2897299 RepID=UPI001F0350C1|nr:probable 2-oxoglutarate dehydrogenase E1 component DHKTD1, mitochondrial isoform X2 [Xenia sp. Carnegie-2017]